MKWFPVVVRQGDYLDKLAYLHGFDAEEVWNDARNAPLRSARDPNVLYPGDILQVPKRAKKAETVAAGQGNVYRAAVPTTVVKLRLVDDDGPLRNVAATLCGASKQDSKVTSDGDGFLVFTVPVLQQNIRLTVHTTPEQNLTVLVGHNDPVDTRSGLCKRLAALGYIEEALMDAPTDSTGEVQQDDERQWLDEASVTKAVRAFQRAHALSPTGRADQNTQMALVRAHGS